MRATLRSPSIHVRCSIVQAVLLLFAGASSAQTTLSGPVYDGNGGPLLSATVYLATGDLNVPAGQTLTVQPGAIVKFSAGRGLTLDGTLDVNGTGLDPVYFTSYRDDSVGGDTNGDGPTNGYVQDWIGLQFQATSDSSDVAGAVVRYASWGGWSGVEILDADITLRDSTISDCEYGIDLNNSTARPTVSGCAINGNTRHAVANVPLDAVPGFSNNSAQGNGWGNSIQVTSAPFSSDVTIDSTANLGGGLLIDLAMVIPAGRSLTLGRDVVFKFNPGHSLTAQGILTTRGRPGSPVVFTSFRDDEVGGDTNGDGVSAGARYDWIGLIFESTAGASVLESAFIRFTGYAGLSAVRVVGAGIHMKSCLLESGQYGLDLAATPAAPTVEWCTFRDFMRYAVTNVPLDDVPGFAFNTASGCGWGNYLHVNPVSPTTDVALRPRNQIGGAIYLNALSTVPAGVTVNIEEGTVLKFYGDGAFSVLGTLNLLGTAREPVILTSHRDDAIGGDSNGDGATVGSAGDWSGVAYAAAAEGGQVENVIAKFAGYAGRRSFLFDSPNVSARSIRVYSPAEYAFEASALSGNAENWVIQGCWREGIRLTGGSFDLVHATVVGCSWYGVSKLGSYSGQLKNCVAWGSGYSNYNGFAPTDLLHCDGSPTHAGSNGNINLDPQFVDEAGGDLRLQAGSPCFDTADLASALPVATDFDDESRVLDPLLTGVMLPDMGAYERSLWNMSVLHHDGAQPGATLTFRVDGPPGDSTYMLGLRDGTLTNDPFGVISAGNASLILLGSVPVGQILRLYVPRTPGLLGTRIGIQTRTTAGGNPLVGNITTLYRDTISLPVNRPFELR